MGTQQIRQLLDVVEGGRISRLRLLAPIRYLFIGHPEKARYDIFIPCATGIAAWVLFLLVEPKPQMFGADGLLRFARDLLIMAVPFMVGALAAVSMGAPGPHLDRRPVGAEIRLDDELLTLRQFLCYLLGYLSFLGIVTLIAVVAADLMHPTVQAWTDGAPLLRSSVTGIGSLFLSLLLSSLVVTVFWALYFLTEVANQRA